MFDKNDLKQIKDKGLTIEKVKLQIEILKKENFYLKLKSPCTCGNGITILNENDFDRLTNTYQKAADSGKTLKFVPASGAASRMFESLHSINIDSGQILSTKENDPDYSDFFKFIKGIKQFAFYDDLNKVMSKDGYDIESLLSKGEFKDILKYLLTSKGLNYDNYPKGLIKFHVYDGNTRTPFEEHIVEAAAYTRDVNGVCKIHFTIPSNHNDLIREHINKFKSRYEQSSLKFDISFSFQKPSTDTIAVDLNNIPIRDENGILVFRPGGHGALLENLNSIDADIVFLKNIDNVVPDRLKNTTYFYKRVLGGYLVEIQNKAFGYLKALTAGNLDDNRIDEIFKFAKEKLSIIPQESILNAPVKEKTAFLLFKLNRPIRVCGMVKNAGNPGGGPFWVEGKDKTTSLQIVENAQIDPTSKEQQEILASSTHFNPVDIVCGVRDFMGNRFDLSRYVDNDAVFITRKSKQGRLLKALELPGLWNGSMAYWNTVFVEVPAITFNPVKKVTDLLNKEHLP